VSWVKPRQISPEEIAQRTFTVMAIEPSNRGGAWRHIQCLATT